MTEKLDPEDVHEIMDGCFEILRREIRAAGGTINQYKGDGIMTLFGAPIAYDDAIRRRAMRRFMLRGVWQTFLEKRSR
jgi:class 3 adenylate cyclase